MFIHVTEIHPPKSAHLSLLVLGGALPKAQQVNSSTNGNNDILNAIADLTKNFNKKIDDLASTDNDLTFTVNA
jgi:hypothetical protein